jgi:transcriptional regulator with XRE-family HTH domain
MTSQEATGSRIKANRLKQGISQVELARMLYVPRSTVWRWETGKAKPSPIYLYKLEKLDLLP